MNQNSYAMKLAAFVSVGLMSVCGSYAGDFLKVDINTASSPVQEGWRSYVWSKNAAGTAQRVAYDGIPPSNAPEGVVGVTIVAGKGLDSAAAVTPDATTTSTIYSFDRTTVSCESAASLAAVYRDGIISDNQWANYFYYVTVDGLKPNVGYRFRSYHHDNGKKTEVKVVQLDRAELETTVASVAGATFVSADDADKFCSTQCVRTDASGKFVIRIRGSVEQARFNGFVLGEFADAGLHHEHSLNASFSADKVDEAADDNRGAIYGYAPWPNAEANNWCQSHRYTGYIRVPGNPGEKVTCNFVSSMARRTQLWIGGKLVIHTDDNTDRLTGAKFTNRFYLGPQVELESGWQAVEIRFENWWEGAGSVNSQSGWEANFGAGVDWKGRCEINPANYVKFLDPGDGSFLRTKLMDVRVEAGSLTADISTPGYDYSFSESVSSIVKTGEGTLSLVGAIGVSGSVGVLEGTLRLGSQVPDGLPGLKYEHSLNASFSAEKVDETYDDIRGARFGYDAWPNAEANNWCQSHRYTGYIRVPGNPGEKVTCNFVSSMLRRTQLWIGGKLVIHTDDNTDRLTGAKFTNQFYLGPQVELESGWQAVEIRFENWWEGAGPASSQPGWEANFGAGVDWQGRCDANPANYVKFLDPGDGSFLKVSMATKDKLDPAKYRATFGVELYCAPGTTLDLNDYLPYTPAAVTRLSGCPRIAGGEIVASGWMLSVADIKKDQPLIVAADAVLGFDADAELVLDLENDGVVALPRRNGSRLPVVRVEDGGVLKSVPKLRRDGIGGWRLVPSDDGKGYDLLLVSGFTITVR